MTRILTMTFFILTLFSLPSQGQTDFRVMSYNVENLFDTKDDPFTADNDFLPATATGHRDGFTINYSNWQKSLRQRENGAPRLWSDFVK